jgi:hypothetical protein
VEEVEEEASEEVENDEADKVKELEKQIETMKKEFQEQKELVSGFLDTLIELSNRTQEIKGVVEAIPVKR